MANREWASRSTSRLAQVGRASCPVMRRTRRSSACAPLRRCRRNRTRRDLPVDPGLQPAIDDLILAGRFGDAIAAAREAYGLTLGEAFHGVLTGKRDLTT